MECQENLTCLEAERKFYADQLQKFPKSQDFKEGAERVKVRIEAAQEELRRSKAPVDQLASKSHRLKKVEAWRLQEGQLTRELLQKLRDAQAYQVHLEEELEASHERYHNHCDEKAALQEAIDGINKGMGPGTPPSPPVATPVGIIDIKAALSNMLDAAVDDRFASQQCKEQGILLASERIHN